MDESVQNSNSVEHLGQQTIDSKQHFLKDNHVEDKSMIEEYMLDTSLENCLLNEELMECLESSVKGNLVPNHQEMIIDHNKTGTKEVAQDITEQFKSPIKSRVHKSLPQSASPGLSLLPVKLETPSKASANTSIDSLVDAAELDSLLDGVEWSPMISCPDNLHSSR